MSTFAGFSFPVSCFQFPIFFSNDAGRGS